MVVHKKFFIFYSFFVQIVYKMKNDHIKVHCGNELQMNVKVSVLEKQFRHCVCIKLGEYFVPQFFHVI